VAYQGPWITKRYVCAIRTGATIRKGNPRSSGWRWRRNRIRKRPVRVSCWLAGRADAMRDEKVSAMNEPLNCNDSCEAVELDELIEPLCGADFPELLVPGSEIKSELGAIRIVSCLGRTAAVTRYSALTDRGSVWLHEAADPPAVDRMRRESLRPLTAQCFRVFLRNSIKLAARTSSRRQSKARASAKC